MLNKWRRKRAVREFVASADPEVLEQERAALARENSEAPDPRSDTMLPTEVESEMLGASKKFYFGGAYGIPALKPTDSSFKVRGLIEPEDSTPRD